MRPALGSVFEYGIRGSYWAAGYHTGRDYRPGYGEPVRATRSGRVIFAGVSGGWGVSYGIHVVVQTGTIRHGYCHMSRAAVRRGQAVREGQLVGSVGQTGNVTGPHVHYEERTFPWTYWRHRRPVFDVTTAVPTLDSSEVARAVANGARHARARLFKTELASALRDAGLPVRAMNRTSRRFGESTRENVRRLSARWYGQRGSGVPAHRFVTRLGERRSAWRTRE